MIRPRCTVLLAIVVGFNMMLEPMVTKTSLIIILGSPASGKSTLARRLAADLSLPVLGKDDVKEALFDTLGFGDAAASRRMSDASFAALLRLARTQLECGVSCLLEGNFRPEHGTAVAELLACTGAQLAQIGCRAEPGEIERRFRARQRHPGHRDAEWSALHLTQAASQATQYLEVPGPRWSFDSAHPETRPMLVGQLQTWRL